MLIVEPPAARYSAAGFDQTPEDHLLERVSALENRLHRLTDKLEQALAIVLKHARNTYFDHTLLQTLIAALSEAGAVEVQTLYAAWRERCEEEARAQDETSRLERLREAVTSAYRGNEVVAFGRYVDVAIKFFEEGDTKRGLRTLERAAALAPSNAPLLSFIGRHYFEAGRMTLARDYLERAFAAAPNAEGVRLLLGLACGDDGETERARELLREEARRDETSRDEAAFAAHYALGRLLAAEQKWSGALDEFKQALAARPSPEAHYVVGCVYYQLNRDRLAARHLRKAIELDEHYAEAFYMLGLVHLRAGEHAEAQESFAAAHAADVREPRYRAATIRRLARSGEVPASPPLFYAVRAAGKKLLTGGDPRLARLLREAALGAAGAA